MQKRYNGTLVHREGTITGFLPKYKDYIDLAHTGNDIAMTVGN
jgi:hypothetical protein